MSSHDIHNLMTKNVSEKITKNLDKQTTIIDFYDDDGNTIELTINKNTQDIKFNYKIKESEKTLSQKNEIIIEAIKKYDNIKLKEEEVFGLVKDYNIFGINENDDEINLFGHVNNLVKKSTKRLDWDEYFMSIALLASCRSPCERLHVGCVIVKNNRIISMGYNGFIAGTKHKSHIKDNHEQATVHSETNAITDCAGRGVSVLDSIIYVTHYPCLDCYKTIASAGIKNIVYLNDYRNNELKNELNEDINISFRKLDC